MLNFGLKDFYKLLQMFVATSPTRSTREERMQTFAVLQEWATIDTPNLQKVWADKGKDYFFSRRWHNKANTPSDISFDYPALFAFETSFDFSNMFKIKSSRIYRYELVVLDKLPQDKKSKVRVTNDLYLEAENWLMLLLQYLEGVALYDEGWYNEKIAEAMGLTNRNERATTQFRTMLKDQNPEMLAQRWRGGLQDTYGTLLNMRIEVIDCEPLEYDIELLKKDLGC